MSIIKESPSMDFEEGEVEDISDSDRDASLPDSDDNNVEKVGVCDHANSSRPHRKTKRRSRRKSRGISSVTHRTPNPPIDSISYKVSVSRPDYPSLMDYFSEEAPDIRVVDRAKFKHPQNDFKRKRKKRKRDSLRRPMGLPRPRPKVPDVHRDDVPQKKQELCKFYAVGVCSKESSCMYLHGEFPCKFFHLSDDCHHGEQCKFSHAPLTSSTRALLEKIATSKHSNDRSSVRSGNGRLLDPQLPLDRGTYDDHGDVDYRFNQGPCPISFEREQCSRNPAPQRPQIPRLFSQIFQSGARPYHGDRDSAHIRGTHPFSPTDRPPMPIFPGDVQRPRHFSPIANNSYMSPNYPTHLPIPHPVPPANCGNTTNGYRPLSLMDPHPRCQPPRVLGNRMRMADANHPRFPRYRSPRFEQFGTCVRNPVPSPFEKSLQVHEEAIVSSELDKMAALLASSKPSTNDDQKPTSSVSDSTANTPAYLPNISLTEVHTNETLHSPQSTSVLCTNVSSDNLPSEERQMEPAFSLDAIDFQNPIPWRLIPLDMSVKIPYPLMQLSVSDLPYRLDDPRLRGQLATLRPQRHKLHLENELDSSLNSSDPDIQVSIESKPTDTCENNSNNTSRRPVKLQLNEMASTFVNSTASDPMNASIKQGDRSYLDDPRFRRRRILTTGSTANAVPNASTMISTASQQNNPGLSGSAKPDVMT